MLTRACVIIPLLVFCGKVVLPNYPHLALGFVYLIGIVHSMWIEYDLQRKARP